MATKEFANGMYSGEFNDRGQRHGTGTHYSNPGGLPVFGGSDRSAAFPLLYSYKGGWYEDNPHGQCSLFASDGTCFTGNCSQGFREGFASVFIPFDEGHALDLGKKMATLMGQITGGEERPTMTTFDVIGSRYIVCSGYVHRDTLMGIVEVRVGTLSADRSTFDSPCCVSSDETIDAVHLLLENWKIDTVMMHRFLRNLVGSPPSMTGLTRTASVAEAARPRIWTRLVVPWARNQQQRQNCPFLDDGDIFEGQIIDPDSAGGEALPPTPYGYGKLLRRRTGEQYHGEWRKGLMHGRGLFLFPDDMVYSGLFDDGRFQDACAQIVCPISAEIAAQFGFPRLPTVVRYVGAVTRSKVVGDGVLHIDIDPFGVSQKGLRLSIESPGCELSLAALTTLFLNRVQQEADRPKASPPAPRGRAATRTATKKDAPKDGRTVVEPSTLMFSGTRDDNHMKTGTGTAHFLVEERNPALNLETKVDRYEGEWKDDLMHGQGLYRWSDGRCFEGSFFGNRFEGRGVLTFPFPFQTVVFEGFFHRGKAIGLAQISILSGLDAGAAEDDEPRLVPLDRSRKEEVMLFGAAPDALLEVSLRALADREPSKKHHFSSLIPIARDGVYTGQMVRNSLTPDAISIREGFGTMHFPNGRLYCGQWKDGERHGSGVFRASDGIAVSGSYIQGQCCGPVEVFFTPLRLVVRGTCDKDFFVGDIWGRSVPSLYVPEQKQQRPAVRDVEEWSIEDEALWQPPLTLGPVPPPNALPTAVTVTGQVKQLPTTFCQSYTNEQVAAMTKPVRFRLDTATPIREVIQLVIDKLCGTLVQQQNTHGRYVGQLNSMGQRHGTGTLHFKQPKGDVYAGEWECDLMHGTGVYTWRDGSRYEGQFLRGERHGTGTLRFDRDAVLAVIHETRLLDSSLLQELLPTEEEKENKRVSFYYEGEFEKGCLHGEGSVVIRVRDPKRAEGGETVVADEIKVRMVLHRQPTTGALKAIQSYLRML